MLDEVERVLVQRVSTCDLRLSPRPWQFAQTHSVEIEKHWQKRSLANPNFFNGRVLIMGEVAILGGVLRADLFETSFASFLYWKDGGYPDRSVRDGFGSALIRSSEGHVLLARQLPGHLNSGLLYMPGGFIDLNDVGIGGKVDIDASIARELREETGLEAGSFERRPGYLITQVGLQVSIAVEFRSVLPADQLQSLLLQQVSQQGDRELEEFVVFDHPPQQDEAEVVAFSRHAIEAVLAGV